MNVREIRRIAKGQAQDAITEYAAFVAANAANLDDYKDEDGYVLVFAGTVFGLTPSGKYYLPWASSNVESCPRCKGQGCDFCGQLGSREAYEDEVWDEAFNAELEKYGYFAESGEGDPCDIFVGKLS